MSDEHDSSTPGQDPAPDQPRRDDGEGDVHAESSTDQPGDQRDGDTERTPAVEDFATQAESEAEADAQADQDRDNDDQGEAADESASDGPVDAAEGVGDQERSIALMLKRRLAEIRDPESDADLEELDEELQATLLALVLGELPREERDKLLARAENEPRIALELQRLSQHLRMHQNVRRVAPRAGSFSRLSGRMRERELLREVIPGRPSVWRRSVFAAAAVLVVALLFNLFVVTKDKNEGDDEGAKAKVTLQADDGSNAESRLVPFGQPINSDERSADILLTTGGRGYLTKVRMAPNSRFTLTSSNQLNIERGGAERIEVDPEAETFTVTTPHARFRSTNGGSFSVRLIRNQSQVCVVQGLVLAEPVGDNVGELHARTVYEGYTYSLGEELPAIPREPEYFLQIRLEPVPGHESRFRVRFINQSGMELRMIRPQGSWQQDKMVRADIRRADPNALPSNEPVFQINLDQDQRRSGEQVLGKRDAPVSLQSVNTSPSGTLSEDEARWLTLAASGAGSQVDFEADLMQVASNLVEADYTLNISYYGPIRTEHFGTIDVAIPSTNLRLDMKPTDGRLPDDRGEDESDG